MNLLSPNAHRGLDFVTVIVFVVAPSALSLTGLPAMLSYALAAIHLLVTVVTAFPGRGAGPLPFPAHGALEGVVGVVLLGLPWALGWMGSARTFFIAMGAVILVVWMLSRYRA